MVDRTPSVRRDERAPDPQEEKAVDVLRRYLNDKRERVFTSRQLEVQHEDEFFHWITNRAVRELEEEGLVKSEVRELSFGGNVKLLWHKSYRYPKRSATAIVQLVEEYSAPNIGGALGLHGELLVLEGFARAQFVMRGREVREHMGVRWSETEHDFDFVFEREGRAYGVEVKNTLSYMDYDELRTKIRMAKVLGVRPVFAARMLPKHWIEELRQSGGFGLVLKYQLYPVTHRDLANRIREEMGLPVDAPRALSEGTMARFLGWHEKQVARV